jgi:hypothetical protein
MGIIGTIVIGFVARTSIRSVIVPPCLFRTTRGQRSGSERPRLQPHPGGIAVRELYASGLEHGTDLGQLFRARRLPGKGSLGLADRVASDAASTDRNLPAVPAKQLPSLPDLVTSDHR